MTDLLNRLKGWLKRASNPRASTKTEARNLLNQMEADGFNIVSTQELAAKHETPAPVEEVPVVALTRAERARQFYNSNDYAGLYDLKKASKVYWDRLGFDAREIDIIVANKP